MHALATVAPNPPSNVRVETRKDGSFHFEWTPPNESVGGIGGYNITYGENCGNCSPAAGFLNQTEELTAECSECIGKNAANNSTICSLNVSTVSEDCWFNSCPVEAARCSGEFYIIITHKYKMFCEKMGEVGLAEPLKHQKGRKQDGFDFVMLILLIFEVQH